MHCPCLLPSTPQVRLCARRFYCRRTSQVPLPPVPSFQTQDISCLLQGRNDRGASSSGDQPSSAVPTPIHGADTIALCRDQFESPSPPPSYHLLAPDTNPQRQHQPPAPRPIRASSTSSQPEPMAPHTEPFPASYDGVHPVDAGTEAATPAVLHVAPRQATPSSGSYHGAPHPPVEHPDCTAQLQQSPPPQQPAAKGDSASPATLCVAIADDKARPLAPVESCCPRRLPCFRLVRGCAAGFSKHMSEAVFAIEPCCLVLTCPCFVI